MLLIRATSLTAGLVEQRRTTGSPVILKASVTQRMVEVLLLAVQTK